MIKVRGQNGGAFKPNAKDSTRHTSFNLGFCPTCCAASQHKNHHVTQNLVILGYPIKEERCNGNLIILLKQQLIAVVRNQLEFTRGHSEHYGLC